MSLRPRAHIHLANIADNWRSVRATQPGTRAAAVIKADGYGHGLAEVADTLHDAGCDHFFVAHAYEGEIARRALGGHAVIYVLNGPAPYDEALYQAHVLTPIINSDQQFQTLVTWIQSGLKLRDGYGLHFDTGMNRLGIPVEDTGAIKAAVEGMPPALIMSHLSCSDAPDDAANAFQLARFKTVTDAFAGIPTSLTNSDGIWLGSDYHANLTRPGIALYGGGHPPEGQALKPGMTLEAPVLQVRRARSGETVGYGATYRLTEDRLLATLAIGYGDGFPRSASNSGFATLDGIRCPIVGRVSMDLMTIDVSAASHLARPGVFAQILGPDAPLEEQAALAGTIGYELTTGLTPRVKRIYDR
ncbi:MAG: alanine racemase [Pseudomonadota bacterium]